MTIISYLFWTLNVTYLVNAGDNAPFIFGKNLDPNHDLFKWFKENKIIVNRDKCHLLLTNDTSAAINTNGFNITNNNEEKSLSINSRKSFQVSAKRRVKCYMHSLRSSIIWIFAKETLLPKNLCSISV